MQLFVLCKYAEANISKFALQPQHLFSLAEIGFTMQNPVNTARCKYALHQHNSLLFQYLVKCLPLIVITCALERTMTIW